MEELAELESIIGREKKEEVYTSLRACVVMVFEGLYKTEEDRTNMYFFMGLRSCQVLTITIVVVLDFKGESILGPPVTFH